MSSIILVIIIVITTIFIKVVPANTVIIIDRNSHYLKTKKSGFYFFNPNTDKITTSISKFPISKSYSEYFETHDGKMVRVNFFVKYHAEIIDDVLIALESVRRSIDDVMNGSVYWSVNNLSLSNFINTPVALKSEITPKLLAEASELKINIDQFDIINITEIPQGVNVTPFKPHLNSYSAGPIKFN